MRIAAILLVLIMIVPVTAHDFNKDERNVEIEDDILTHYEYFERVVDVYFEVGWASLFLYFYPEMVENNYLIGYNRDGEFVYEETHEEGISYNITFIAYRNWTGDPSTFALWTPCNLDSFSFAFSTFKTTSTNVSTGHSEGWTANASVERSALEERSGVSVSFDFKMWSPEEWDGCEFVAILNVTALFVSTYKFHEWILGGCIDDSFYISDRGILVLSLIGIGGVAILGIRTVRKRRSAQKRSKPSLLDSDTIGIRSRR